MSDLHPEHTTELSARRRLLRGSFAAPAVLTVCSGSTFAQAATSLTCVAKQVIRLQDTTNSATTTDVASGNWVRVPLQKLAKRWGDGDVDSIWISGAYISSNIQKLGTTVSIGPSTLGSSSWLCYRKVATNGSASSYVQGQIYSSTPVRTNYELSANGEWVAVLVDASGNITGVVGLQSPGSGNYPVHATSCWSSFNPRYKAPWL